MRKVSVLVPLMLVEDLVDVQQEVSRILNLPIDSFTVFPSGENDDLAIQIFDLKVNFMQVEEILEDNHKLNERIERLKQMVHPYEQKPSVSIDTDIEGLMKKAKKLKEFKEENKKLRHLLRVQLQSTQKIRQQTQRTMINLKQEFDILVKQMQKMGMNKLPAGDYASRFQIHLD